MPKQLSMFIQGHLPFCRIEGAVGIGKLIHTDGHQSALFLRDGAGYIRTDFVQIDNGIARGRVEGKAVIQSLVVSLQFAVHGKGIVIELVDAADHGLGVCISALHFVPSNEVAGIVGTEGNDHIRGDG